MCYNKIKKAERGRAMENKTYIAIDLKSFYASVECIERGLDPMTTNLIVAAPILTTAFKICSII